MAHLFLLLSLLVFVNGDDGWFWHVTDFHYDPTYLDVGVSCEKNVSDRGPFGNSWCDSPWKLVTSSIEAMYDIKSDVDFIIWTGDSTPHVADSLTSQSIYQNIITNITEALKSKFNQTPVYPVFGNHDYYPSGQFPPHSNHMYDVIYNEWKDWINDDTQKGNFQKGAYYTIKTASGIRIVGLNTNLYYRYDKISWNYRYSDPAGQFQFMAETLQFAKENNETVMILAHVPPGVIPTEKRPWFYPQFNHRFNEILLEYSDSIAGLYFGHEHVDTFRIYYAQDKPVLVKLCAPSVTPWTYIPADEVAEPTRNPGIRLVNYNRVTGIPIEIRQYYLDFKHSNVNHRADWKLEYTMPRDYKMADLSPKSFGALLDRMKSNSSHEYSNFATWRYVSGADDVTVASCSSTACKKSLICSIANPDVHAFAYCDNDGVGRIPPFGK